MPRINNPKPPKRAPKIDIRRGAKKKPCSFCQHGVDRVDYKDLAQLRKYISDRGKIRGRKVSGNCQQHQRDVGDAIKTARELALLPYTQRTVTERRGGRALRVGQQRHFASRLDSVGHVALMLLAVARYLSSPDLPAVRDVLAKLGEVFVVHRVHAVLTERARILLRAASSVNFGRTLWWLGIINTWH